MEKFFATIGALLTVWIVVGICKKLVYASRVEQELRALGARPHDIETTIGRSKYMDTLIFLRREGVDPRGAARTLDLYVLKGFAEYCTGQDPHELQLLRNLGMTKPAPGPN